MASITLIIAAGLFGAAIGILAILVIGIRRDERAMTLARCPRSDVEAATRRLLGVGIRRPRSGEDEEA